VNFLPSGPPFSIEALAGALDISTWSARRLLPKLGFIRVGGLIRIPRENVESYLAHQYSPPKEEASPRRRRSAAPGQLAGIVDAATKRVRRGGR
jgi:hypothetical protein